MNPEEHEPEKPLTDEEMAEVDANEDKYLFYPRFMPDGSLVWGISLKDM